MGKVRRAARGGADHSRLRRNAGDQPDDRLPPQRKRVADTAAVVGAARRPGGPAWGRRHLLRAKERGPGEAAKWEFFLFSRF